MEAKYIVAIVACAVFIILLLVYAVISYRTRCEDAERRRVLKEMYTDPAKMEYDFAVYDEETQRRLAHDDASVSQLTIDDIIGEGVDIFGKIDSDGLEEITGNYIPE